MFHKRAIYSNFLSKNFSQNLTQSKLRICITILSSVVVLYAENSSITLKAEADTSIATVGDQINLKIDAIYPVGTILQFPRLEENLGQFEIVKQTINEPTIVNDKYKQSWQLTLAIFDTGKVTVPSIEVNARLQSDSNNVLTFRTDSIAIAVYSVLPPGTTELKDIKPPLPIRNVVPWNIIIFVLILVVIAGTSVFHYRRWKRFHPQVVLDEKFLDSSHTVALRRLEEIRKRNYSNEEELRNACFLMSEVVKEYIERRYFIRALEMTSDEIIEALDNFKLDSKVIKKLNEVFKYLDLVKFSKHPVNLDKFGEVCEKSYQIIEDTKRESFLIRR